MPIYRLENTIQNYVWGSYTAIAELLCRDFPCSLPQAELWMGAHSKAPSSVLTAFGACLLTDLLKTNPIEILGKETFKNFGAKLPYLFKVLAINKPLSIQVHPNRKQAIAGYDKENYEQKPIDCPERNYKDRSYKFECVCALTPLWCLCGFRNILEMQSLIGLICPNLATEFFEKFLREPTGFGLEKFLKKLVSLPEKMMKLIISQALLKAKQLKNNFLAFELICCFADIYPGEISVFAPVLLDLFYLEPKQAIFIPEGVPHTYLKGVGIELMVNSDNVLRGGLTNKHVDMSEFLNVLEFVHRPTYFVGTEVIRPCEVRYMLDVEEFSLSIISVSTDQTYLAPNNRSVEILICTSGEGLVADLNSDSSMKIKKGDSILITASVVQYSIRGDITLFKAGIPL